MFHISIHTQYTSHELYIYIHACINYNTRVCAYQACICIHTCTHVHIYIIIIPGNHFWIDKIIWQKLSSIISLILKFSLNSLGNFRKFLKSFAIPNSPPTLASAESSQGKTLVKLGTFPTI